VIKVDVEKNPEAADLYAVEGLPTFVFFHRDGSLSQERLVGADEYKLEAITQRVLMPPPPPR